MAEVQPPGFLNGPPVSTDAAVYRDQTAALAGDRAGVCGATHFAVSQSGTPGMSVAVAAGSALVDATTVNGLFTVRNDAAITALAISPANPTNPRIDRVVVEVRPGSPNDDWRVRVVDGTPAGAPTAPAVPDNALLLADVAVAAAASSITNANITERRSFGGAAGWSQSQFFTFNPGGSTDSPTGPATWITLTSGVVVPPSCTVATARVSGSGLFTVSGDCDVDLVLTLGGNTPTVGGGHRTDWLLAEAAKRRPIPTIGGRWTGLTPGATLVLLIRATRVTGTGAIRADATSRFDAEVTFQAA